MSEESKAAKIARLEDELNDAGYTENRAQAVYDRAKDRHEAALAVWERLNEELEKVRKA